MKRFVIGGLAALMLSIYLSNASWLAPKPEASEVRLIANRGVHHTFDRVDLTPDSWTGYDRR